MRTLTASGYEVTPLAPGTVAWFTPGTIHRLVNEGDLRITVLMQNSGLPEAGDAVLTLPPQYLDEREAELHPADPAGLTGIGARLHALALGAGQDVVAGWLVHLFGRVTCSECETVFGLAESAAVS